MMLHMQLACKQYDISCIGLSDTQKNISTKTKKHLRPPLGIV